jgi:FkbM family methyltransferase
MIKSVLKKVLGPRVWRSLKTITGRGSMDEVDIIYDLLCGSPLPATMIDVGGHYGSSLELFAADGWDIYAFEPDPENRAVLKRFCSSYANVEIDSRAVSNQNKEKLPFFTSNVSTGISSLSPFHDTHEESSVVDTVTLESFTREKTIEKVDFLKIDTEGHDLFVLQGVPWKEITPRVILCEFEDRKTRLLGYDFHELAAFLVDKGYSLTVSEWYPVVKYGVKHRWRRFADYPCDLMDVAAWGNIIAIKDPLLSDRLTKVLEGYEKRYSENQIG